MNEEDENYIRTNVILAVMGAGCTQDYAEKVTDVIIEIIKERLS